MYKQKYLSNLCVCVCLLSLFAYLTLLCLSSRYYFSSAIIINNEGGMQLIDIERTVLSSLLESETISRISIYYLTLSGPLLSDFESFLLTFLFNTSSETVKHRTRTRIFVIMSLYFFSG